MEMIEITFEADFLQVGPTAYFSLGEPSPIYITFILISFYLYLNLYSSMGLLISKAFNNVIVYSRREILRWERLLVFERNLRASEKVLMEIPYIGIFLEQY